MTEAAAPPPRPLWRRLAGFNLLTAFVLGVGGWYVGWFGGHAISAESLEYFADTDYNELSVYLAYLKTKGPRSFEIRCAELCGLWHGYMYQTGHIVPQSQFAAWIKQQQSYFAPVMKYLPKYATTYLPDPSRRAG
jgi:hypothetical protein